jgi:hypothetical protein
MGLGTEANEGFGSTGAGRLYGSYEAPVMKIPFRKQYFGLFMGKLEVGGLSHLPTSKGGNFYSPRVSREKPTPTGWHWGGVFSPPTTILSHPVGVVGQWPGEPAPPPTKNFSGPIGLPAKTRFDHHYYILTFLLMLTLLTSCEGFKVLTIHNTSGYEAKVTVRPGLGYSDKRLIHNYPNDQTSDSTVVILKPDSSMTILSIFTGMMFSVKIRESELRTDYLKIETEKDTIVAESRSEILWLLKDERTRYRRKNDKSKVLASSANFGNIFIR